MIYDTIIFFAHCTALFVFLRCWQHYTSLTSCTGEAKTECKDQQGQVTTDRHPHLEGGQSSLMMDASSSSSSSLSTVPSTLEACPASNNTNNNFGPQQQQGELPPLSTVLDPWVPLTGEHLRMYLVLQRGGEQQQENYPTTNLGRAWNFVYALRDLVTNFNQTYQRNSYAVMAPVVGNFLGGPQYKTMLKRFYLQYDPPKQIVMSDILKLYKGKEIALFEELARIYRAPDPLKAFYNSKPPPTSPQPFVAGSTTTTATSSTEVLPTAASSAAALGPPTSSVPPTAGFPLVSASASLVAHLGPATAMSVSSSSTTFPTSTTTSSFMPKIHNTPSFLHQTPLDDRKPAAINPFVVASSMVAPSTTSWQPTFVAGVNMSDPSTASAQDGVGFSVGSLKVPSFYSSTHPVKTTKRKKYDPCRTSRRDVDNSNQSRSVAAPRVQLPTKPSDPQSGGVGQVPFATFSFGTTSLSSTMASTSGIRDVAPHMQLQHQQQQQPIVQDVNPPPAIQQSFGAGTSGGWVPCGRFQPPFQPFEAGGGFPQLPQPSNGLATTTTATTTPFATSTFPPPNGTRASSFIMATINGTGPVSQQKQASLNDDAKPPSLNPFGIATVVQFGSTSVVLPPKPSGPISDSAIWDPYATFFGHNFYATVLETFYRTHMPTKVSNIANIVGMYHGKEGMMFQELSQKYNAPNPLDFFLASIGSPLLLPSSGATRKTSPTTGTMAAKAAPSGGLQQEQQRQQSLTDSAMDGSSVVKTVALDDMVFLAERLFEAQEAFRTEGASHQRPYSIDTGYHYTKRQNLDRIQTDGLLTQEDRKRRKILSKHNGSSFGEGIYTSCDPQTYSYFGPVGLIVLRLKGKEMDAEEAGKGYTKGNNSITSKSRPGLVVLEKSTQCLPIIQFSTDDLSTNERGLAHLSYLQRKIQCLVEEHFHDPRIVGGPVVTPPLIFLSKIEYAAPSQLNDDNIDIRNWYENVGLHRFHNDECCICLNKLEHQFDAGSGSTPQIVTDKTVVRLKACGHEFHEKCARNALKRSILCPLCRRPQKEVRGTMPSGTMTIFHSESQHCQGYEHVGTIIIRYVLPPGPYPNSRRRVCAGADRTAYVPNTLEGIRLVSRLKYAFQHGLTFKVATIDTDGVRSSRVTWSTIGHKTSLNGGPTRYGYPDPTYLYSCNQELTDAGVP